MRRLVQPRHEVALSVEQEGDHEEAAEVAIRQQNVTGSELVEHFSEQRRLAGLLARVGSHGGTAQHGGCQGQGDHDADDREAESFLLRRRLRISGLILFRVRHAAGGPVDHLHMALVPQPTSRNLRFAAAGHVHRQTFDDFLRQLGAGSAIGPGVLGTRFSSQGHQQHEDSRDGRHAGTLLALVQHLREERPQGQRRGVDLVLFLREVHAFVREGLLDLVFREDLRKGQSFGLQEGGLNQTKSTW